MSSNHIDCLKLINTTLPKHSIDLKNKKIYNYLLNNVFKKPNFDKLNPQDIRKTFDIIDNVYFNGKINKYIKDKKIHIDFKSSSKLTVTAGICKQKTKCMYEIGISELIISNLFNNSEKSLKINGLHCVDRLECFINLFQHEITHLIIMMFCPDLGKGMGGHTTGFLKIVNNQFGHTEYKHMLLSGDSDKMDEMVEDIKTNVELGDYVISKMIKGIVYEGVVVNINPKSVGIKLSSGKLINIYYHVINKLQKSKDVTVQKTLLKKSEKNIVNTLKIGDHVKVKIKGEIVSGIVTKINPQKARIKISDGKEWYVPYGLLLI